MVDLGRATARGAAVRFTPTTLGGLNGAIALELRHVLLDDVVSYAAMSYVWGDLSHTIETDIIGAAFPSGRNLYARLERLREKGMDSRLHVDRCHWPPEIRYGRLLLYDPWTRAGC
jgi:hypothetical protein